MLRFIVNHCKDVPEEEKIHIYPWLLIITSIIMP